MIKLNKILCLTAAVVMPCVAMAQDSGALVDALVKKGILTDQEAEDIRADLVKDYAQTSAGKLNISSSVSALKIYGDARFRYEYTANQAQIAAAANENQNTRSRFRLRLNADYTFADGWSAGVGLQTNTAQDSGNQNFNNEFNNASIFIDRVWLKWQATDWLTLTGGKQANPFYTTEMVWDPDINPAGGVENVDFGKLLGLGKFGLELRAGQLTFGENTDSTANGAFGSVDHTDPWLFVQQLVGSYKFDNTTKLTFAPGFMTWLQGAINAADGTAAGAADPGLVAGGVYGNGNLAGQDATKHLSIITAPGDISWVGFEKPMKFYWDFAYNVDGKARARTYSELAGAGSAPGTTPAAFLAKNTGLSDAVAWQIGYKIGENKKKGDWSVYTDFRQVGLTAVDPNLSDSDVANGTTNQQTIRVGSSYNFTDWLFGTITFGDSWNYKQQLSVPTVAPFNTVQYLQIDLNYKF